MNQHAEQIELSEEHAFGGGDVAYIGDPRCLGRHIAGICRAYRRTASHLGEDRAMAKMLHHLAWLYEILDERADEYRDLIEHNNHRDVTQPWGWLPLIEREDVRGGILHVGRQHPIPLHDHPGTFGVLLILSGEIRITQFDRIDARQPSGATVKLCNRGIHHLGPRDVSIYQPDHGNLHQLQAISDDCMIVEFMFEPYAWEQRSWYFTLPEAKRSGDCVMARRISQQSMNCPAAV